MATFLRKVKSTISAAYVNNDSNVSFADEHSPSNIHKRKTLTKGHRQSHIDLGTAVESDYSIRTREQSQQQQQDPFLEFRRRLARKTSTFSLRGRLRRGEAGHQQAPPVKKPTSRQSALKQELVATDRDRDSSPKSVDTFVPNTISRSTVDSQPPDRQVFEKAEDTPADTPNHEATKNVEKDISTATETLHHRLSQESANPFEALPTIKIEDCVETLRTIDQKDQLLSHGSHVGSVLEGIITCKKMATESAAPPVPYTRLKEIATSACESALGGISSYTHQSTESWNTSIINNILGTLVTETTQKGSQQPQFKYVVNSTIIQHSASSSSVGDSTASGRRGMHAASGAFWNNEKDGMWSFKYEAAEAKGLDVVVGIIWVWVG